MLNGKFFIWWDQIPGDMSFLGVFRAVVSFRIILGMFLPKMATSRRLYY